jgi:Activator of Hsp90 ATPase homolog 1-like protein
LTPALGGIQRLVWTEPDVEGGMTTSLTFTDLGNGMTEVIAHQTNVPEMYRSPESQAGMQSSFDRFAAYMASL